VKLSKYSSAGRAVVSSLQGRVLQDGPAHVSKSANLDIEPTSSIPQVHAHLTAPEPPTLPLFPQPFAPRRPVVHRSRRHPHCYSQDVVTSGLFGDMEKRVPDAPSTANAKRDAITCEVDLWQVSFKVTCGKADIGFSKKASGNA
jgi:hypothetical protein